MSGTGNKLSSQQCSDLPATESPLSITEVSQLVQTLDPPWQLNTEQHTISHTYRFKDYYQTMAFVNVIAQIAHQQNHHPDLKISYNRCTVNYRTHSVNGISMNDFICAAKINTAQVL